MSARASCAGARSRPPALRHLISARAAPARKAAVK
jgi:hypothetical protein